MITSRDLEEIQLFAGVEEEERRRLARRAADIQLEPGEWLIREGKSRASSSSSKVNSKPSKTSSDSARSLVAVSPVISPAKRQSSWVLPASSPYGPSQNAASPASSASNYRSSSSIVLPLARLSSRP